MSDNAKSAAPTPPIPGPEHEVLRKDVGTWDAVVEVKTGGPTQVSTGVMVGRLACGGLWLVTDFKNETGFEGHGVYGFDPVKGKYTGFWVDPMRTGLAPMEGLWDPSTKTMTMVAELVLPGGRTMRWRETTETVDDDTQVWRSLMPGPDGREVEVMKTTYRRRRP
jgi:hypothetical protein